jgi:uroporphyrinogen decarboxylase
MNGTTSKERILQAIANHQPDRVPVDYWGTPEYDQQLAEHFNVETRDDVLEKLDVDIRYIYASGIIYEDSAGLLGPTPAYRGSSRTRFEDGSFEDLWGVTRKCTMVSSGNVYRDVIKNPLKDATTVSEIEAYEKWPKAGDFDYSDIYQDALKYKDKAVFVGGMPGCATTFIQCWYLRGLENILTDLIRTPNLVDAIVEKITDFQCEYHHLLLEKIGNLVDVLMLADDYGTQTNLMLSPEHFRRFFKKPTQRLIDLGKEYGLKIMLHSDGNIRKLIPEFIEMGIDIINPIQNVGLDMDPADLKREFGRYICFHGAIDTQQDLLKNKPQETAALVKRTIDTLGPNGGYILSPTHMLQLDVPMENVLALYQADRKIGRS